jgi:2-polyprenyl-3-methyl-5-hydroxy-6-metoxy-1,4-benzoquinol methylase
MQLRKVIVKCFRLDILSRVIEKRDFAIGELKRKLEATRLKVREKDIAIKKLNVKLTEARFRASNMRIDSRDIDVLGHNTEQGMDSFFHKIEDGRPYREFGAQLRKYLSEANIVLNGKNILDVGTGPGIALDELLLEAAPQRVVGVDMSTNAIDYASKAFPTREFYACKLEKIDLDFEFDVVLCTEVLEHLVNPAEALLRLKPLVNVGGALLLTVPDGRIDFSKQHINFWSPEGWKIFIDSLAEDWEVNYGQFKIRPSSHYFNNVALLRKP